MKKQNKPMDVHPRRLARRIAKAKMERAGWRQINRFFRANWRSILVHKKRRRSGAAKEMC